MAIYIIINRLPLITDEYGALGFESKMEDATKMRSRSGLESGSSPT